MPQKHQPKQQPHRSPFFNELQRPIPNPSPYTDNRPVMSPFANSVPRVSPFTKKRPMMITPDVNSSRRPTYSPAAKKLPLIYSTGSNRPRIQLPQRGRVIKEEQEDDDEEDDEEFDESIPLGFAARYLSDNEEEQEQPIFELV
jgi:hypothetical protein